MTRAEQHSMRESAFWSLHGIADPHALAAKLYALYMAGSE